MNFTSLFLIGAGGAIGSVARALVGRAIPPNSLPWATIVVNVGGSLLIGWLMARLSPLDPGNLQAHRFWVIGFCGGFTTFSTFSWQTLEQMQKGNWSVAVGNVLLSVVLCLAATWLGWRLAR